MTEAEAAAIVRTAEGFLELGNPEQAWMTLDDLSAEFCTAKNVLHIRMRILLELKQWRKAEFIGETLVGAEPENGEFWYGMALARCQQGETEGAKAALKQALTLKPEMREAALKDPLLEAVW